MSQAPGNNDLPAWIVAVSAAVPIVGLPFAWISRKLSKKVDRAEWAEYLRQRDQLSEDRHKENLKNFGELFKVSRETGERVARLEGVITGVHRRL